MPVLDSAARTADDAFFEIETEIDWLATVSPTGNHDRWREFVKSGYRRAPPLTYLPLRQNPKKLRERLKSLPLDKVENPLIELLLREKRSELQRQIDLIARREKEGFPEASVALFGDPGPVLLSQAREILETVPANTPLPDPVGPSTLTAVARSERENYQKTDPSFDFGIFVQADINSTLMVNHGDLWIDSDTVVPKSRVPALIAHEVGTHVVTRHNGRKQPLRQLETGLPDYDRLQEGLAALAEWLAGCLPPDRLRILAARVIAADLAIKGTTLEDIFADLHDKYGIEEHPAFDTAVRALRGGGLTKDAVYLAGLADLLAWLAEGHDIGQLFIGKIALSQLSTLNKLAREGLVHAPSVIPHHLTGNGCAERLETARTTPITAFYTRDPS